MKEPNKRKLKYKEARSYALSGSIGLLVFIGIAAYWNSFDGPFVFDDLASIELNAGVRFGQYLKTILTTTRSLTYYTFALNARNGLDVWGFHFVNLAFHLLNGVFIFLISREIFSRIKIDVQRARIYSILAASLFIAHPIQTESVSYISSRTELVSVFFYLIGVFVFIKWPPEKIGFLCSGVIIVLLVFGLGGKETAITLPAVLFLYDYLFLSGASFRNMLQRWRFYAVFFAATVVAAYYILVRLLRYDIGNQPGHLGYWQYFLTQSRVIVEYVRLLFIPYGLTLDHDVTPSQSIAEPAVIASILLLLGVIGLGWYFRRRQPVVTFAIFWFFITLSPTSSFLPIIDVMFEHRVYMPLAGACLLFPMILEGVAYLTRHNLRVSVATAGAVMVLIWIGLTHMRNEIWGDEVRLFADVVEKSPLKPRPYNNLSMAYFKRGQYDDAIDVGFKAMKANVRDQWGINQVLGNMLDQVGRYDEAIAAFKNSIDPQHNPYMGYNNIGMTYFYMWDALKKNQAGIAPEEFARRRDDILANASNAFKKCLEINPDLFMAFDSLINAEVERGNGEQLVASAEAKLKIKDDFDSLYTIGKVRWLQDRFPEAIPYFERASHFDVFEPLHKIFFYNFGYALDKIGQLDRAAAEYTKALELDPGFREVYYNVGLVYFKQNKLDQAIASFNQAIQITPGDYLSRLELAKIFTRQSRRAEAREQLQRVLSVVPGQPLALQLMQLNGS